MWQWRAACCSCGLTVLGLIGLHLQCNGATAGVSRRQAPVGVFQVTVQVLFNLRFCFGHKAQAGSVASHSGQHTDGIRARVPCRPKPARCCIQLTQALGAPGQVILLFFSCLEQMRLGVRAACHGSLAAVQRLRRNLTRMVDTHQAGCVLALLGGQLRLGLILSWCGALAGRVGVQRGAQAVLRGGQPMIYSGKLSAHRAVLCRSDNMKMGCGMTRRTTLGLMSALCAAACALPALSAAQAEPDQIDALLRDAQPQVIQWRRHLHANPELSNREFETAKYVAKQLRGMGLRPETGIAHTGLVALIQGGKPGPTVALRADMDALPVTEQTDVPFASTVTTNYQGEAVGVMHACGHDTHVAMLLGAARVLTAMREQLAGDVLLIFQPAEEGAPPGERGGAELMLAEGVFDTYKPDVVFGQHITSNLPLGVLGYRSGPLMASSDRFTLVVRGKQTHGSRPWGGVDPITTASQIILGAQTIISRQVDITKEPAILSFGKIRGGVRSNIIPDAVELVGTIRNFDMGIRQQIFDKLKLTAEQIAASAGATATLVIDDNGYPVTSNDAALTTQMLPTLRRVAGAQRVIEVPKITGAEDFSYFAREVPGFYYFLGGTPLDRDPATAPANHSPLFYVDESAMAVGTAALTQLALDYMAAAGATN